MWEKTIQINTPEIKCEIKILGPCQTGSEHKIAVMLMNSFLPVASVGKVTVEILQDETVIETFEDETDINIPARGEWTGNYTWTPTVKGNYKVKVTYAET